VLARIAGLLGDFHISISEVVQEGERNADQPVAIVVTTHEALEADLQSALARIDALPVVKEKTRVLRIYT
jgi:homoserine dehydrogenase